MAAGGYAQGENELEEDLLDQVQTCLGAVLEQFGDAAMPLMEGLMPQIGVLLTPKSSVEEKRVGICIMDDIMEHTQEGEPVVPFLLSPCLPPFFKIQGRTQRMSSACSMAATRVYYTVSNRKRGEHSFILSCLSDACLAFRWHDRKTNQTMPTSQRPRAQKSFDDSIFVDLDGITRDIHHCN